MGDHPRDTWRPVRQQRGARRRDGHCAAAGLRAVGREGYAGSLYDPELAALFDEHAGAVLGDLDTAAGWDDVLAAEPGPARSVAGEELDDVLGAMADLVDLKSPYLAGHSRGVAQLAAEAARLSGLPDDEAVTLRCAA